MIKKKNIKAVLFMKKASDLAIIETFFERMPQLFIQMYAYLYELSLKHENNLFSPLFITYKSNISLTIIEDIEEKNYHVSYLIAKILPVFSMVASIISINYTMYSDYVVSRKVFFLKNWMTLIISKTSQEITKPLFYYELTIPSKMGYFAMFGINILTKIVLINICFQLLVLLPVKLILKIIFVILFTTVNFLIFGRFSVDYFMRKKSEYNLTKKILNRFVQYFKFISYYPLVVFKKSQIKRFFLSFSLIFVDLILIFVLILINFLFKTLNFQLFILYLSLASVSLIVYSLCNLIQFFVIHNDEYTWTSEMKRQSMSIELHRLNDIKRVDKEYLEMLIENVM